MDGDGAITAAGHALRDRLVAARTDCLRGLVDDWEPEARPELDPLIARLAEELATPPRDAPTPTYSLTTILPVLTPRSRSMNACGALLQPALDDRLAELDPPLADRRRDLRDEVAHPRAVVDDDEAAQRQPLADGEVEVAAGPAAAAASL